MLILSVFLITGCDGGGGSWDEPVTISPVSLTVPTDGATGVSTNTKITATFSEEMDPATINTATFILYQGTTAVPGTVNYTGVTAVFTPASPLAASTTYIATITTGAKNLAGNPLESDYVWSFTTGTTADGTAPTVTLTVPFDTETGVSTNTKIIATFSEAMNPLTINTTTFTLFQGATAVSGTVLYSGVSAVFTPASNLAANTTYTATITTVAEDLAGNALVVPAVGLPPNPWTFTTGAGADATAPTVTLTNPVDLATGVAVSKKVQATFSEAMDPTTINTATFTLKQGGTSVEGIVTGKVYAADYAVPTPVNLTTAISDMETAFVDAAGRAIPDFTELGAGNISGMTLSPGLYKWGTGVLITGAGVTISGGANDVWIFQISGNLTVNSGAIVTLAGGAQAKNIFWQVDGGVGVEFDTGAAFQGIILASKAIIFKTGATLTGRALAQTAVTLQANTITAP